MAITWPSVWFLSHCRASVQTFRNSEIWKVELRNPSNLWSPSFQGVGGWWVLGRDSFSWIAKVQDFHFMFLKDIDPIFNISNIWWDESQRLIGTRLFCFCVRCWDSKQCSLEIFGDVSWITLNNLVDPKWRAPSTPQHTDTPKVRACGHGSIQRRNTAKVINAFFGIAWAVFMVNLWK